MTVTIEKPIISPMIREEIKKARKEKKWSQERLAEECRKLGIPMTFQDISQYERGEKNPALDRIEAIAKALNKEWILK